MTELHVYANDCEWVIATSREDAAAVWCESMGESLDDYTSEDLAFEPVAANKPLTVWCDVDTGKPSEIDGDESERVTMTCAEWATKMGRCYLATTEQ